MTISVGNEYAANDSFKCVTLEITPTSLVAHNGRKCALQMKVTSAYCQGKSSDGTVSVHAYASSTNACQAYHSEMGCLQ